MNEAPLVYSSRKEIIFEAESSVSEMAALHTSMASS